MTHVLHGLVATLGVFMSLAFVVAAMAWVTFLPTLGALWLLGWLA